MDQATLIDENNGIEYSIEEPRWCSDHKNPLSVSKIKGICSDQIDLKERSIWRYKESFPISISTKVSLGEGCTPLVCSSFSWLRRFIQTRMVCTYRVLQR